MIIDDIAGLITTTHNTMTARQIGRLFNRSRKWTYAAENGCNVVLNYDFVAGLHALGYELVLQKIDKSARGVEHYD